MIFCMKIKKVICKMIPASLVVIARYALSSQYSKFAISLEYVKKQGRDGVDILHLVKYQSFLKVDAMQFGWHGQSYPKYPI